MEKMLRSRTELNAFLAHVGYRTCTQRTVHHCCCTEQSTFNKINKFLKKNYKECSKKYLPLGCSSHWKLLENWTKLISLPHSFSLHFAIAHWEQFNRIPYSTPELLKLRTFIKLWLKRMCEIVEKMSFLFKRSNKKTSVFFCRVWKVQNIYANTNWLW